MLRSLLAFAVALVLVPPTRCSALIFSAVPNSISEGPTSIDLFVDTEGLNLIGTTMFIDVFAPGTTFTGAVEGPSFPGTIFNTSSPKTVGIGALVISGPVGTAVLLATLNLNVGASPGFLEIRSGPSFLASSISSSSISFSDFTFTGGPGGHLVDINIPEPSPAMLLGMSLSGLAALRRRQRARERESPPSRVGFGVSR